MKKTLFLLLILGLSVGLAVSPTAASCPATHFTTPAFIFNPFIVMNIYTADITVNGGALAVGDEIAIMTPNGSGAYLAVGVGCYDGTDPVSIIVYQDAPGPPLDGYTTGGPMRIVVYDDSDDDFFWADPPGVTFIDPVPIPIMETESAGLPFGVPGFTIAASTHTNSSGLTVPTVGQWGLIILTLLMLIGGTLVMRKRRVDVPVNA